MNESLRPILNAFPGKRILLVGDFMLDRYVFGNAERISPEAPVPVMHVTERQDRVGGAGSVALNVCALDAQVACFGLLGHDPFGDRVCKFLEHAGADVSGLIRVDDRPTITKTRLVGLAEHRHRQQILRVDDELVAPPSAADAQRLIDAVLAQLPHADVLCLEDYAKGVLAPDVCATLIAAARQRGVAVLVDPARKPTWANYRGATLLTPNRAELEIGVRRKLSDSEIDDAAREAVNEFELDALVVTLGRDGARLVRAAGASKTFPTRPRAVYDNTGAGDAVLATVAVAVAAGATLEQAVPLANIAGGLEVSKFGCVPIRRSEMLEELSQTSELGRSKLRTIDELIPELEARRNSGETVVFTNGCFDILHPGHLDLLGKARALGSLLVVGLNSDASVRRQGKGDDRPIRTERDRAAMLAGLNSVDFVVLFDDDDPGNLIEQVLPDVLVKGADWVGKGVVGQECVEARGGRVALIDLVDGFSTTAELAKIRGTSPAAH